MTLAPLRMSAPASDGLILNPLVVLAHQSPATRDSYAPLVDDLLAAGVAVG